MNQLLQDFDYTSWDDTRHPEMLRLKVCRKLHRVRQSRQSKLAKFKRALQDLRPDFHGAVEAFVNEIGAHTLRGILDHYEHINGRET